MLEVRGGAGGDGRLSRPWIAEPAGCCQRPRSSSTTAAVDTHTAMPRRRRTVRTSLGLTWSDHLPAPVATPHEGAKFAKLELKSSARGVLLTPATRGRREKLLAVRDPGLVQCRCRVSDFASMRGVLDAVTINTSLPSGESGDLESPDLFPTCHIAGCPVGDLAALPPAPPLGSRPE